MRRLVPAAALLCALAGCGSKPAAPPAATPAPMTTPAATVTRAAAAKTPATQAAAPKTADAVNFEVLLPLLPEVDGWTRGTPRGEHVTMGVPMSRASARYENGEATVDVEVLDSAFHQLILAPISSYLVAGFDERTTDGYRKSAAVNGYPGFEEWNSDSRRAQVTVLVADRFIVNATGRDVDSPDSTRAIVQKISLGQLAGLR